jgi:hypothetical protein
MAGLELVTNELMCTPPVQGLPNDLDTENLEMERDITFAKDPYKTPLHQIGASSRSVSSPRLTIVPPRGGLTEAQEEASETSKDDVDACDTIVVNCPTSGLGSESSDDSDDDHSDSIVVNCSASNHGDESPDDSDDENYVEECQSPAKRRRVTSSKTVRYARDRSQKIPMSPADTLDNESQGMAESASDIAYMAEEIPVSGVLTLKEVDGNMQYCLTFSQDLLPRFIGKKLNNTSSALTSAHSVRSRLPSVQGRGRAGSSRYRFKDEDDQLLKQLKEEGKSWSEIAKRFPRTTKGSLQVRYSTKLKDR